MRRSHGKVWTSFLFICAVFPAVRSAMVAQSQTPLEIQFNVTDQQLVEQDQEIVLDLNRLPEVEEGRLAILIGDVDLTDLFSAQGTTFTYRPDSIPYPSGSQDMVVYLVTATGDWTRLSQVSLRFTGRLGFSKSEIQPRVDVGVSSQVAEGHSPDENRPPRSTYADFNGQFDLSTEHVRRRLILRGRMNVLGFSNQQQALRFGTEGQQAPLVDLSSYLVEVEYSPVKFSLGHVAEGTQRHLINSFSSRGMRLDWDIASQVDLSVAWVNGSDIVGWGNIVGLSDRDHEVVAGTLGIDFFKRPGTVRLETTLMDGSVLPISDFNQGVVNDAEENKGFGFRLLASDPSDRFRFDGGFARSEYTNPDDPSLDQGQDVVPVVQTTDSAYYIDASGDLFRNIDVGASKSATLTVAYRRERVDPLFRSLAAYSQSDSAENLWEVRGNVAEVNYQVLYSRAENNLDDIASILKTKTRRTSANSSAALGPLIAGLSEPSSFWPNVNYSFDRTHQFGDSLPVGGGFNPSHIPDQVSTNHLAGADWQFRRFNVSYNFNHSFQDNKQPGRELSDFSNTVNSFRIGVTPHDRVSFGFDISLERAENQEFAEVMKTRRLGANLNWATSRSSDFVLFFSRTKTFDDLDVRENRNTVFDVQWSIGLPPLERARARYFIRFNKTIGDTLDRFFGLDESLESWTLNMGFNVSLF